MVLGGPGLSLADWRNRCPPTIAHAARKTKATSIPVEIKPNRLLAKKKREGCRPRKYDPHGRP